MPYLHNSFHLTRTLHLLSLSCQVGGAHISYDYATRLQAPQGDPIQHGAMLAGITRIRDVLSLTCDARGQHRLGNSKA